MVQDKMMTIADQLEGISKDRSLAVLGNVGQFRKAFMVAAAIKSMKELLTADVMAPIMELQNAGLGFKTDKPEGYPMEAVKEALIEASIRGLQPVGNQFNIIAKRCYVTKEGFTFLMKNLPGLTDLKLIPSVPVMQSGGATVKYKATWNFNGKPDSIERELPIKVNAGMGADAVLGKAERKIRAAIYSQITGTTTSDGEVSEDDTGSTPTTATKAEPEPLAEKLKKAKEKTKPVELTDAQKCFAGLDESMRDKVCVKAGYDPDFSKWDDTKCSNAMNYAGIIEEEEKAKEGRGY